MSPIVAPPCNLLLSSAASSCKGLSSGRNGPLHSRLAPTYGCCAAVNILPCRAPEQWANRVTPPRHPPFGRHGKLGITDDDSDDSDTANGAPPPAPVRRRGTSDCILEASSQNDRQRSTTDLHSQGTSLGRRGPQGCGDAVCGDETKADERRLTSCCDGGGGSNGGWRGGNGVVQRLCHGSLNIPYEDAPRTPPNAWTQHRGGGEARASAETTPPGRLSHEMHMLELNGARCDEMSPFDAGIRSAPRPPPRLALPCAPAIPPCPVVPPLPPFSLRMTLASVPSCASHSACWNWHLSRCLLPQLGRTKEPSRRLRGQALPQQVPIIRALS